MVDEDGIEWMHPAEVRGFWAEWLPDPPPSDLALLKRKYRPPCELRPGPGPGRRMFRRDAVRAWILEQLPYSTYLLVAAAWGVIPIEAALHQLSARGRCLMGASTGQDRAHDSVAAFANTEHRHELQELQAAMKAIGKGGAP